jgi:hypothetical protein
MDRYENAVDQLKTGIKTYIDKKASEIPCDRTFTALVTRVNSNGTYEILLNNVKYNNIKTIGGTCYVNETVKVLVPQNNYNNMFILKAIEDVGNYKLFDYTNDKGIILTEGNLDYFKKYTWVSSTGKDCFFIVDNEYYVTDDELYMRNGLDVKGNFFAENNNSGSYYKKINVGTTGLYYTNNNTQGKRCCGYVENKKDNRYGTYQRISFKNCRIWTLDNIGNTSIEYNDLIFPSNQYRVNWGSTKSSTYWGTGIFTEQCSGYITTNIPIFENSQDASEYVNNNKEILNKAINYKKTEYKEIFTTSFLMNEKAKVKVDAEILMDYNSDEYNHKEYTEVKLPYGKNYGYTGFDCNLSLRETFNRLTASYIYNSSSEYTCDKNWGFFFEKIQYDSSTKETHMIGILARITDIVVTGKFNGWDWINFYKDYGVRIDIVGNCNLNTNFINPHNTLYTNTGNYYTYTVVETVSDEYINLPLRVQKYGSDVEEKRRMVEGDYYQNQQMNFDGAYVKYDNIDVDSECAYVVDDATYKNGNRINIPKNVPIYHYPLWFFCNYPVYIKDTTGNIVGRFYNADAGDYSLYNPKFEFIKDFAESLKIKYYIDGELVEDRQPKCILSDNGNTIRLMNVISSESGGNKTFSIKAGLTKGIGVINKNNLLITISGAGLLDQTYFSGDIEIEEEFSPITPINPIIVNYDEDVDAVIVERPNMRGFTWGQLRINRITWQIAKDEYVW